jgi:hypothetical protein
MQFLGLGQAAGLSFVTAMHLVWNEPTSAQGSYDGTWSVLIITDAGECDRAYRYGIRIERGQIVYDGEAGVAFTGQVEANG